MLPENAQRVAFFLAEMEDWLQQFMHAISRLADSTVGVGAGVAQQVIQLVRQDTGGRAAENRFPICRVHTDQVALDKNTQAVAIYIDEGENFAIADVRPTEWAWKPGFLLQPFGVTFAFEVDDGQLRTGLFTGFAQSVPGKLEAYRLHNRFQFALDSPDHRSGGILLKLRVQSDRRNPMCPSTADRRQNAERQADNQTFQLSDLPRSES